VNASERSEFAESEAILARLLEADERVLWSEAFRGKERVSPREAKRWLCLAGAFGTMLIAIGLLGFLTLSNALPRDRGEQIVVSVIVCLGGAAILGLVLYAWRRASGPTRPVPIDHYAVTNRRCIHLVLGIFRNDKITFIDVPFQRIIEVRCIENRDATAHVRLDLDRTTPNGIPLFVRFVSGPPDYAEAVAQEIRDAMDAGRRR
jgi:hypothetical protein